MDRLGSLGRRYGLDTLIVFAAVVSAIQVAFQPEGARTPQTTHWFTVPAVAALSLVLVARRRFPFATPAGLWLFAIVVTIVDPRLIVTTQGVSIAGFVAAFLLGNLPDAQKARAGLAIVLVGVSFVVYNDPLRSAGELVFMPILFAIGWIVGFALQERVTQAEAAEARAIQAEREREAATRLAVAEERARIARELHDIVAHSVSVMVLQVGAVRHKLPDVLSENRQALQDVELTGRSALAEMRRLLGAMRSERDELELTPHPGLGNLEPLLDEVRRTGLQVQLHVDGTPVPLPRAIDLSAYRIIQEGLTNALKHAQASTVDVTVRYDSRDVSIEIRDDGVGVSAGDGLGHGLVGVRERVKLYGGEMSAGAVNGGGFVLGTRLPLRELTQ